VRATQALRSQVREEARNSDNNRGRDAVLTVELPLVASKTFRKSLTDRNLRSVGLVESGL